MEFPLLDTLVVCILVVGKAPSSFEKIKGAKADKVHLHERKEKKIELF